MSCIVIILSWHVILGTKEVCLSWSLGSLNFCLPYCGFCRGTSLSAELPSRTRREVRSPRWPPARAAQPGAAGGFYCSRQPGLMTWGSGSSALCHTQRCRRCKILMWSCTEIWLCARWSKEPWTPIKLSFFSISGDVAVTLSGEHCIALTVLHLMGQEVLCFCLLCSALEHSSESWKKNVFITMCFHLGPLLYLTGFIPGYLLDYTGEFINFIVTVAVNIPNS